MIRGFYSGASTLIAQQSHLNTIANNLANTSTTGFKPQQAAFSALLYENLGSGDGVNMVQSGHGVRIQQTGIDFTQGDLKKTDIPTDFAIVGDGFFAIENKEDETISYTRDGCFQYGQDGSNQYLVNSAGNYVLDAEGERIEIKSSSSTSSNSGTSGGTTAQTQKTFDYTKIGVYTFGNNYGLELVGGNQFKATEASGEATALENPVVKTGYLENAAVQVAEEMVKMIEASKGFSFGSKVVQAADEMEKTINSLR